MRHEDITPELLREVSSHILRFLQEKVNRFNSMGSETLTIGEHAEEEVISLIQRMHTFGIQGLLVEGNLLPGDFEEIDDLRLLEQITCAYLEESPLDTICKAAYGRLRLCFDAGKPLADIYEMELEFDTLADFYTSDITLEELAALANMNIRSLKNAMAQAPEGKYYKNSHGDSYIDITYAQEWLRSRIDFKPTKDCSNVHLENGEYVLVPVASDGSMFSSTCEYKRGGYTVGEKGDEIKVADFDEALEYLQSMPLAKWRRPNASGNMGIVSAVEWKRVKRSEL